MKILGTVPMEKIDAMVDKISSMMGSLVTWWWPPWRKISDYGI